MVRYIWAPYRALERYLELVKSTARGLQLLRVQTGKLYTWFQHGSGAVIPGRYRTGWAPIHIGNKATALRWEHTTTNMAAATTGGDLNAMHRYKLPPPHFTGEYATFEEWKHKFVAYLGLQNSQFPRLLQIAETFDQPVTDELLADGARNREEADLWIQLSKDLHYLLINVCQGQAAVLCRQHTLQAVGLETWRQLHRRFSIPLGTRSVGYLTKLLKPQFNENKFEESFTTWEFEIARYERDNQAPIPDNIKIAILLNETKGPLQQYLQLRAGAIQRYADIRELILEYHRASTAFSKMQAQQQAMNSSTNDAQPMDIGATYKGKGKYNNKGKGKYNKGKGKTQWHNKGKGYTGYSQQGYKGKGPTPIGHGNPFKGAMQYKGKSKGKGPPQWQSTTMSKGKGKGTCYNVANRATMQGTAEWQSTTSQT